MQRYAIALAAAMLAVGLPGCRKERSTAPSAVIAATNSYMESAVMDLLGSQTPVIRLAGPGMCPGHFDVRPSQVVQLRRCRVLLRFDFQKSLDAKLSNLSEQGLRIAEIRITGGLCQPDSYVSACRQAADALVEAGLLDRSEADERLGQINRRLEDHGAACLRQVESLAGTPVVVSVHQEAFCRWLGLNVVAAYSGADVAGVAQVDQAIRAGEQAGAKLIIANLPEGRRVADALAERLGAKVVIFGNFPTLGGGQPCFDDLLTDNVARLLKAAGN